MNLSAVAADNTLMAAARFYAQIMRESGTLGHNVGPYRVEGATHGASRAVAEFFGGRLRWGAGNGGEGQRTPQQLVDGWMDSLGHRVFIISPEHLYIGVGRSGLYSYMFMSYRGG
jgi:uncharacterized protein YkwD